MKGTMNCSRKGTANHIERRFDIHKTDHIDPDRLKDNVYLFFGGNEKPAPRFIYEKEGFKNKELEFYKIHFTDSLKRKNEVYLQQKKYDKIKTIEDMYSGEKTKPEEMILLYGNKDNHPPLELVKKAFDKLLIRFNDWNRVHGGHVALLDCALHAEEATPHWHLRRVFIYQDKYGYDCIGINKALKQSGMELPDPNKEEGRFNNVKMKFDEMIRDWWLEIGRELGLELDNAPKIGNRGEMDIHKYKKEKTKEEIENNQKINKLLEMDIDNKEKYAEKLTDMIEDIENRSLETAFELIDQLQIEEREISR